MALRPALAFAALSLCVATAGPARAGGAPRRQVTVAAAADLRYAFDELIAVYRRSHPEVEVRVSYGSSGVFFTQIVNGAPYDLFLSADGSYPRKLLEQGAAELGSDFVYGIGHLVVWVPRSSGLDLEKRGISALLDPSIHRIAIANPAHAPYGQAAMAALRSLGVERALQGKLVLGENAAQAMQFVTTGAADAGIVPLSLAAAPALHAQGRTWEVPASAYPRLEQVGVLLRAAKDRQAARDLAAFLRAPQAQAVLERYGFAPPRVSQDGPRR